MARKEAMINRAASEMPKGGGDIRKNGRDSKRADPVGGEKQAAMNSAFMSNPGTEKNPLKGAGDELRRQHPHAHNDRGPHHGTTTHVRHEALHGLKK